MRDFLDGTHFPFIELVDPSDHEKLGWILFVKSLLICYVIKPAQSIAESYSFYYELKQTSLCNIFDPFFRAGFENEAKIL